MKHLLLFILIFFNSVSSSCQSAKQLTFESIENNLIDFLVIKNEIRDDQVVNFKHKKSKVYLSGIQNGYSKNELINGIYVFSAPYTHTKVFYLIVENEKYIILDVSDREGLEIAIKDILDFCERQRYCSDLTQDYVSRMIAAYYKINKNPIRRNDINCIDGVKDKNG
ncbi:hypothetical protein [Flavobacterium sp.]|uniref:hypothetical protein n=1 Tax=Flavobacterium sp. TaxID=239 RepID=UPI0026071098|nr:hypothetical protein [Flavobacterium sp.]